MFLTRGKIQGLFDKYIILRREGLKDYLKSAKENLKITPEKIKEEFDNLFIDKGRVALIIEEDKNIKAYIIGT
ncbi:MAG TPA: hypothetical protein VJH65_03790 [Candidatus Nanoarchaeia archaeon]|nr:hypothetical protein [Candidatus Nanoarchaeia archaeon]